MKCKLLPPTRTDLAGFNPLAPMANVSQVLLLANPTKVIICNNNMYMYKYYCEPIRIKICTDLYVCSTVHVV